MTVTKTQVLQMLKDARARVANRDLPLAVRIRAKETVALCEARLAQGQAA